MIQNNNNFSVLPWYSKIQEQNHRRSYAYGNIYPLYAPADMLLPFQIMRQHRNNQVTSIRLLKANGEFVANITQQVKDAGLSIKSFVPYGYDVIVYPAILPLSINQFDGQYYMELTDGVDVWYSEIFTAVQDVGGYLSIEWYDTQDSYFDSGIIVYSNPNFRNKLYLCTEVGKPDYTFEEEGEQRDGFFFPEKQLSEKTYKFTFLAPEYLLDVMRLIRMSDYVTIRDKYGRVYKCDTFLMTPKWQVQGDLASVECEFQTNTVAKKIGRGLIEPSNGDFNNDFNNDFDNQ